MMSASRSVPSTVTHALGHDALDAGAHELDVRLVQACAARTRRPGGSASPSPGSRGSTCSMQVGPVLQVHVIHAVSCWRRSSFASLIATPLLVVEVRVDPVALGAHRDARVDHEEPEPAGVERQVPHRPPVARRHRRVVQRVRQHPLRRALVDRELLDGRRRWSARSGTPTGAGADEREPLAR